MPSLFQGNRLKGTNYLRLIPVRLVGHEHRPDGGTDLLMPRFRHRVARVLFEPVSRTPHIRIRLDRFGSAVWELTDGERSVEELCRELQGRFPAELAGEDDTFDRVARFYSRLYRERIIRFRDPEEEKETGRSNKQAGLTL